VVLAQAIVGGCWRWMHAGPAPGIHLAVRCNFLQKIPGPAAYCAVYFALLGIAAFKSGDHRRAASGPLPSSISIQHDSIEKKGTMKTSTARWALITAVPALVLSLSACGKKEVVEPVAGAAPPAAVSPKAAGNAGKAGGSVEQQASAKFNAYTGAYNKLLGTFGLNETRDRYLKMEVAKAKPSDDPSLTTGWVGMALDQFKAARALPPGGLDALDQAADPMIAELDKLVGMLNTIKPYYESKAYKDDNLARGKAEDPVIRASFESSGRAVEKFNALLDAEQKKNTARMLSKMKDSGDALGYNTKLALSQGEELVSMFGSGDDIRNAAVLAKADALMAQLEKTLADQRSAYTAAKSKEPKPDTDYENTANNLNSVVGAYRDLKQSKDPKDYNKMVEEYNRAVENANDIRR
jgi:Protein of unknown function (DUF3829)